MADPAVPAAPPSPAQPGAVPAPSPEPINFTEVAQPGAQPQAFAPVPALGRNYAAGLLQQMSAPPAPVAPAFPVQAPEQPQQPAQPPAPAFPVQVPITPPTQDPTQQIAPQPVQPVNAQPAPQPALVDRYAAPPPDPLSDIQPLPALAAEQQIAEPQFTSDQQNHAWAALRAQSKANRKAAEDAQRKYNELVESTKSFQNEKTEFASRLNEKDQRISQLEDEIGKMDLSRSPAFRAKYDAKLDASHAQIMDVLERNGVGKDDAFGLARDIIVADPKDIPGMVERLPTYAQGEIMVFANQAASVFAERNRELDDWRNAQAGLDAAAEREGGVQTAQHIQQAADKAIETFRSLTPDTGLAPAYRVTDAQFAADRDAREQQFKAWVGRASEQDRYMAMLEGFMAPKTYEMLDQMMRENLELKRRLQTFGRVSAPPVSPAPYSPPPPPPPPKPAQPAETVDGFARADLGAANYAQDILGRMFR